MKTNQIIIIVLVGIIGVGLGFFAGIKYQQMQASQMREGFRSALNSGNMSGSRPGMRTTQSGPRGGGMAVIGEILSVSENSITVKLTDGSSKIVILGSTTAVNKEAAGSKTDLTTGTKVAVFGATNQDGSVTAQSIQINPSMGMGMGMGMGMMAGDKAKNTGTKSTDAKEIMVTGQNYSFSPSTLTIPVGQKTRLVFKSVAGMHDFVVDELGIRTAIVQTDDSDWVEFTPTKTGTYQFYCSVGNHKAMGMVGTLTVD